MLQLTMGCVYRKWQQLRRTGSSWGRPSLLHLPLHWAQQRPQPMGSQRAALLFSRHLHPRPNAGPPSRSLPLRAPPPLKPPPPLRAPPPLPVCPQPQLQTPQPRQGLPPLLELSFSPLRLQLTQTRQLPRPPLAACWGKTQLCQRLPRCGSWRFL